MLGPLSLASAVLHGCPPTFSCLCFSPCLIPLCCLYCSSRFASFAAFSPPRALCLTLSPVSTPSQTDSLPDTFFPTFLCYGDVLPEAFFLPYQPLTLPLPPSLGGGARLSWEYIFCCFHFCCRNLTHLLNTLVFLFPFTCGRAHPHTRGEEHPTLPAANLSKTHTHLTVSRKSASPNESAPEASGWSKPHGLVDNKSVKKRVCFLDSSIAYAFLWNQTTSVFLSCFDSNRFVPANSSVSFSLSPLPVSVCLSQLNDFLSISVSLSTQRLSLYFCLSLNSTTFSPLSVSLNSTTFSPLSVSLSTQRLFSISVSLSTQRLSLSLCLSQLNDFLSSLCLSQLNDFLSSLCLSQLNDSLSSLSLSTQRLSLLSLSLSTQRLSQPLSLSLSTTLSVSLNHSLCLSQPLSLSLSTTLSVSLNHSLSLLTTLSLSTTLSVSLNHSLSLSLSTTLSPLFIASPPFQLEPRSFLSLAFVVWLNLMLKERTAFPSTATDIG
ncbi:unnamed protein product [Acanthosepion pharaonis]|uniref:Uncharacterized protein n=1 Tax=Acanthosepion pharaonis TaxID=158019 RepID=A0A812DZ61_ACAPH|nr:unnamed protein product [Sepia pharaonis]